MKLFAEARKKVLGLTDCQDFVREATNNEQWGPTSKQHQQIIQYTYHYNECNEVMQYLYRRLGEDGKNWRTIYKALLVLDNILKNGSEDAVNIALSHTVEVKTLTSFQKIDENGKDVGVNVRERSKQIMELLNDKDYLKSAREDAKKQKKDYGGIGSSGAISSSSYGSSSNYGSSTYGSSTRNTSAFDDDFDSFGRNDSSKSYYSEPKQEPKQQTPEPPKAESPVFDEQPSFGPGSYKDKGYKDSYQKPKQQGRQQQPIQQVRQQPQQQQSSASLFDFGDSQPQQQQTFQASSNLFDMLDSQPIQQQPIQQRPQQQQQDFWGNTSMQQQPIQQRQPQQSSASLFDFGSSQPMQQSKPSQNVYSGNQMNTMDLFSGISMTPTQPMQQQQPIQQQQSSAFDFGDFTSAPSQQQKSNDWRANIRVDSLTDTRKQQQQQKPQQRQTLGGSFL